MKSQNGRNKMRQTKRRMERVNEKADLRKERKSERG